MDRYDFLEAMSGIRDEYIEDAAVPSDLHEQDSGEKVHKVPAAKKKVLHLQRWAAAAAAVLCLTVISLSFRSSHFLRNSRDSSSTGTGVAIMSDEEVTVEGEEAVQSAEDSSASAVKESEEYAAAEDDSSGQYGYEDGNSAGESAYASEDGGEDVSAAAAMTNAGVQDNVKEKTEEEVRIFENSLAEETGYNSLRFTHEVTTNSDDWMSLKMYAYTCAADGFEQVTHFNIKRENTEYVTLETLFGEDTDYITPLSEEVIRQMRERMAADEDAAFWLDSPEGSGYDFSRISPAQDFYFDSDGNLVLCFNEGEAAPTYMGAVEFKIPRALTERLLKESA